MAVLVEGILGHKNQVKFDSYPGAFIRLNKKEIISHQLRI
jgi:hypothetical protein